VSQALVLSPGHAYRLGERVLNNEFKHGTPLAKLLLRYMNALIAQTMQSAACNRHHSVDQQLCRWIMSSLDRLPSNELTMTQEVIAEMMGVRRESVTEAAGELRKAGLIHIGRGKITVLDRPQLEARACECYAVIKREYDRLLPAQTPDAPPGVPGFAPVEEPNVARNPPNQELRLVQIGCD